MKKYLIIFFLFFLFQIQAQQTVGLFLNDSLSINGYTLFNNNKTTYLIDNCGFVVNTWESEFNPGLGFYLLENGNLLRTGTVGSNVFQAGGIGGRIELFDWDGNLLWFYHYADEIVHQHHDIEPLPNGNILVLAWEVKTDVEVEQAGRENPTELWPEHIVEIEPVGTNEINLVWEWHLWDHLIQDFDVSKDNFGIIFNHPELIDINYFESDGNPNGGKDWIHANAITYNPDLDQIAISSRNFNEVWIIDHSTTTEEAASHEGGNSGRGGDILYRWGNPITYDRGNENDQKLFGQHDVRWVLAGHPMEGSLMAFNNLKYGQLGSSVDIWSPPLAFNGNYFIDADEPFEPQQLLWTYEAEGFASNRVSGAHSLPNGNIFICEGRSGHFIEVLPDAETVVWDYVNPAANGNFIFEQGQNPIGNQTFKATRYLPDYEAFIGKDLSPMEPVELNPIPSDCIIFDGTTNLFKIQKLEGVSILNNPIHTNLIIQNKANEPVLLTLFNIAAQKIIEQEIGVGQTNFQTSDLDNGFYFAQFSDLNFEIFFVQKVLVMGD